MSANPKWYEITQLVCSSCRAPYIPYRYTEAEMQDPCCDGCLHQADESDDEPSSERWDE